MSDQDCYFFVDLSIPEEDRSMSVLCLECHDQKMPDTGWFYEGSKEGYGPFDYQCAICGNYVHKAEDDEDHQEEIETASEDTRG